MQEAYEICQLTNMVHDHNVDTNWERYIEPGIKKPTLPMPKPCFLQEKSQKRPNGYKNSSSNYLKRYKQLNYF